VDAVGLEEEEATMEEGEEETTEEASSLGGSWSPWGTMRAGSPRGASECCRNATRHPRSTW